MVLPDCVGSLEGSRGELLDDVLGVKRTVFLVSIERINEKFHRVREISGFPEAVSFGLFSACSEPVSEFHPGRMLKHHRIGSLPLLVAGGQAWWCPVRDQELVRR